jgi:hypothetical protein
VWVADGGDGGTIEVQHVGDVLDAHHPGADDAIAKGPCHG